MNLIKSFKKFKQYFILKINGLLEVNLIFTTIRFKKINCFKFVLNKNFDIYFLS